MSQRVTTLLTLPLVLAAGLGVGCGGPDQPAKSGGGGDLPRWEGHAVQVFDDNIDPAAVVTSLTGPATRNDTHLRERAQTADVVARVKVQTVTVDSAGE